MSSEGDFLCWGPGTLHVWTVEEDCVIMTVRWPSGAPTTPSGTSAATVSSALVAATTVTPTSITSFDLWCDRQRLLVPGVEFRDGPYGRGGFAVRDIPPGGSIGLLPYHLVLSELSPWQDVSCHGRSQSREALTRQPYSAGSFGAALLPALRRLATIGDRRLDGDVVCEEVTVSGATQPIQLFITDSRYVLYLFMAAARAGHGGLGEVRWVLVKESQHLFAPPLVVMTSDDHRMA